MGVLTGKQTPLKVAVTLKPLTVNIVSIPKITSSSRKKVLLSKKRWTEFAIFLSTLQVLANWAAANWLEIRWMSSSNCGTLIFFQKILMKNLQLVKLAVLDRSE